MRPDLLLFNRHVSDAAFQTGVDKGMWGIVGDDPTRLTWPVVIIWVAAAPKTGCPDKYYFHFDLNGYPAAAPTAYPWDLTTGAALTEVNWPKGSVLVSRTFRTDWRPNGQYALYAPCDRLSMNGHLQWQQEHPHLWWQPTFDIMVYLHYLYSLLNSVDYAAS